MSCFFGMCKNKHKFLEKEKDFNELEVGCEYCGEYIRWKKVNDAYCQSEIEDFSNDEEAKSSTHDQDATVSAKSHKIVESIYEMLKKKFISK